MNNNTKQSTFQQYLQASVQNKRYVKLQYFTDIREFLTVTAVTTEILEKDGASILTLNTGEEIPLEKIVKIDSIYSPKYAHIEDFTCDC